MEQCAERDDLLLFIYLFFLPAPVSQVDVEALAVFSISAAAAAAAAESFSTKRNGSRQMSATWPRARSQVGLPTRSAGGHPESATVPVGCQAARLVTYRRCWVELALVGPSPDRSERSALTLTYRTALVSVSTFFPLCYNRHEQFLSS